MCRLCLEAKDGTIRCSLTSAGLGLWTAEVRGYLGSFLPNPTQRTQMADVRGDNGKVCA